jgi:AraC family transcriptional regulator of adaptative response/methylated-DNA-[protein]-cysteine methyltransferase
MGGLRAVSFADDDARWRAVVERDGRADGTFFYAVKTTGVYCRPACSSRQPKRANVVYFPSCADAERAGFRACKRCRPRTVAARAPGHDAVLRACQLIEESAETPGLDELAGAVGLSPFYFHRLFKEVVGVTPKAYAAARQLRRLREGLDRGETVTRAIYGAGFGSGSRCYEGDGLGMTPSDYRNGAAGLPIRYALAESYLGRVLVAATGRGICSIELGDTPAELRGRLAARFPGATLVDGDADFAETVRRVVAFLEAPGHGLDLPLDVRGTAFQRRVWEALRAIPAGSTASYAEVARRVGSPSAVRAVARACAANPVAVAIPCHRVVGSDGDLRGYRWGVGRKRELLRREQGAPGGGRGRPAKR